MAKNFKGDDIFPFKPEMLQQDGAVVEEIVCGSKGAVEEALDIINSEMEQRNEQAVLIEGARLEIPFEMPSDLSKTIGEDIAVVYRALKDNGVKLTQDRFNEWLDFMSYYYREYGIQASSHKPFFIQFVSNQQKLVRFDEASNALIFDIYALEFDYSELEIFLIITKYRQYYCLQKR